MAWDATAKKVAIKAIGQVESSMDYSAINYNDPITVGNCAVVRHSRGGNSEPYAWRSCGRVWASGRRVQVSARVGA